MQFARHRADLSKRSSEFDTYGLSLDRSLAPSAVLPKSCRPGRYRASQRIFLRKLLQFTVICQEWRYRHGVHCRLRGFMGLSIDSINHISNID
jgi:hypothetical protein